MVAMRRVAAVLVLIALAASGCAASDSHDAPAAQTSARLASGVFVKDPRGQIERIAATGHLVAWSVRTPADRLPPTDASVITDQPRTLPRQSEVVVADERGGARLRLDVGRRWVSALRMFRDAARRPQLAIKSCTDLKARTCAVEVVALATAPLRATRRSAGDAASAAGRIDLGRELVVGGGRACATRLSVIDGARRRALPRLRFDGGLYNRCTRFDHAELHGRYVLAWLDGKSAGDPDTSGLEGTNVAALDLAAGSRARWRAVQAPYRYSDGSVGLELGPAVTDRALYWEELDLDSGRTSSLALVALPRDVLHAPRSSTPTTADPIARDDGTACDIAATDDAVYELANPRCSPLQPGGRTTTAGVIRRVVNPTFRPDNDG
jgi:hypothetical protein